MRSYALTIIGIMAVLLTGAAPEVDGCSVPAGLDHECCAEPSPGPTSSCCSNMEATRSRTETDHQGRCDCIHSPSTPAAVIASTAPLVSDDAESPIPKTDGQFLGLSFETRPGTIEHRARTQPPPAVFLLDCCFLI